MSEILETRAQQIKNHPYLAFFFFFIQLFNNVNLFKLHELLLISIKLIYNKSSRARAAVDAIAVSMLSDLKRLV